MHIILIGVAAWLLAGAVRTPLLVAWVAAVVIAVGVRAILMSRVTRLNLPPDAAARSVRLAVAMVGMAWGVGVAVIAPEVLFRYVALLMVIESGLVAGAAWTLTADRPSFQLFLITILGPLPFGILDSGHDRAHVVAVALLLLFGFFMWTQGSAAYHRLAEGLRTSALLAIREQEATRQGGFLGALFASAPVAIGELSLDGVIERVNPRFESLFGYREDESLGRVLGDLIVPEAEREAAAALDRKVLEGGPLALDVERLHKDGHLITVRVSAARVERSDGSEGLVALYEDITVRRQAEAKVAELAARLNAVLDGATQVSIIATDLRGVITVFNTGAEQVLGYRSADIVGYETLERIHAHEEIVARGRELVRAGGRHLDGFDVLVEAARQGSHEQREWTYIRKDGTRVAVELVTTSLRGPDGAIAGFLCIAKDITQRKRAEAALREAEAHFRQLLESSGEGIYGMDDLGRCTFFNPAAATLTGYKANEVIGRDLHALIHHTRADGTPYPLDACPVARTRVTGTGAHVEDEVYWRKNGTSFPVAYSSAPLRDSQGKISGVVVTFDDISVQAAARLATQQAREAAERAASARAAFLANMSHEIRTPLNAILGLTELLFDTTLEAEQRHSLELVRTAGETLLTLLNDILDLSKMEAEHLQLESIPFDPGRLVESTMALLAVRGRAKRLELLTDVGANVPVMVRGDPTRLRQVLTNLIGNAIKFTEQGEVVVRVTRVEQGPGETAQLHFTVRDTGIGIPADKLEVIFEEFSQADSSTTRRYGGTGLGLAIARRLVRVMGGELAVRSELGSGTEFSFTASFPVESGAGTAAIGAPHRVAGRILVVDDNATNRRVVRDMLGAAGARVDEMAHAEAVVDTLRAAVAASTPYALVVLDAQMPGRDGFGLAADIRQDSGLGDPRLVMLTSAGQPGDGQRCRELGIQGYLPKPASRADLLEAVAAVLAAGSAMPAGDVVTRHSIAEARRPLTILLAEDNPVNQQVAATMLRKREHAVDVVDNGRAAVEAVKAKRYDVVLMDVQMPEMDGIEATRAIRALREGRDLPIVALTAHALGGERERCLNAGMTGYLTKPFKPHELFAAAEGWAATAAPVDATSAPGAPPADLDRLRQDLRDAGAEDAMGEILDTFLGDGAERIAGLSAAAEAGDLAAIGRLAHAYKSAAGTIGAVRLSELLRDAESSAHAGDAPETKAAVQRVRAEAERVLAYVRSAHPGAAARE